MYCHTQYLRPRIARGCNVFGYDIAVDIVYYGIALDFYSVGTVSIVQKSYFKSLYVYDKRDFFCT